MKLCDIVEYCMKLHDIVLYCVKSHCIMSCDGAMRKIDGEKSMPALMRTLKGRKSSSIARISLITVANAR